VASTEPLTGVTVQDQGDAATGGTQIGHLATSLAPFTVPRFTSTANRDAQYSTWVTGGGSMIDGMCCTVAGELQVYRAGIWRGVRAVYGATAAFTAWSTPVSDDNARVIGSIAIPDPGWPYRLQTFGTFEGTGAGGGRVDSFMAVGTDTWDVYAGTPNSYNLHRHSGISPNVYTGAKTLEMRAYRQTTGVGTWTSTVINAAMSVEAIPA
jgi:hypothetical protein